MAELELSKVDHWHHRRIVLDGLSMKAPSGRITALLGDAESGRLTALKVIAGIEKAQGGAILIDGENVLRERAGIREAATVFRSAALMPHKTAFENIAYPLRIARFDRETVEARVLAVGEHFGLTDLLAERPKKLTDVQCYQIGLARALVRDPAIYLFELPSEEEQVIRDLAIAEMKRSGTSSAAPWSMPPRPWSRCAGLPSGSSSSTRGRGCRWAASRGSSNGPPRAGSRGSSAPASAPRA